MHIKNSKSTNNMKKTIHTEGQQMFFSKLEVTGPVEAQRISQDVKLNCLNDKNANQYMKSLTKEIPKYNMSHYMLWYGSMRLTVGTKFCQDLKDSPIL